MVRVFKWMQSYFQVVETIFNRNHHIDMILINEQHQLILIVENMSGDREESMIQVHRYTSLGADANDVIEAELVTERVQDIFVPFEVSASNLFLYLDSGKSRLYLAACDGTVLRAVARHSCHYYLWKSDGIDDRTLFKGTEHFPFESAFSAVLNKTNALEVYKRNDAGDVQVFESMLVLDDIKVRIFE